MAMAAPLTGLVVERFTRRGTMIRADLVRAALLALTAALLVADAPPATVLLLLALHASVGACFMPAKQALIPALVETPAELTAMNVASSGIENTAMFLGPALGGLLLTVSSPEVVFAATALTLLWSAFQVHRIAIEETPNPDVSFSGAAIAAEFRDGARSVAESSPLRILAVLITTQCLVAGALTVLIVLTVYERLAEGDDWVGFLNAGVGVGGLLGAVLAAGLVGRPRLSGAFGFSMVLWGLPLLLVAVTTSPLLALLAMGVIGIGNSIGDISYFTMLQRAVPEDEMPRLFGGLESLIIGGMALGGLTASAIVEATTPETGLVAFGLVLPVITALLWLPLRAIDGRATVPARPLALLRGIPMFAMLPPTAIERLAKVATRVEFPAGATVFSQGDPGDRYYLVDEGSVEVRIDGERIRVQGAGSGFGEIALVRDTPRTATIRAIEPVTLWALDRDEFLTARGADPGAGEQAERVVNTRLGYARPGFAGGH
jgi:MFS family permease